ncbi:carbohydrate ABC transporter permease [Nesterenkonia halotolerans]|uniref:carbohydrate ABC transporter permease n=1 Tax=Nesterenkonia halotolerans TaxID=225325 RepID=UPI003EE69043
MTTTTRPARQTQPRQPASPRSPLSKRLKKLPLQITLGIMLFLVIYPMLWMILSSFKTNREFLEEPVWSLPSSLSLENYVEAITTGNLGQYAVNSLVAVVPALILIVLLGAAAGFALEVMVWKGRNSALLLFLVGIMVPPQMILLPLFTVYFQTGLTGSLWPLILTYTAIGLPLTTFMMTMYFRSVPREVFEASILDGAGIIRTFFLVGLPMVRSGVLTVALVQFFFLWNDLLIALTFTQSDDLRTIQVGLLNFSGRFGATDYGPMFAAISLTVVATLALYLVMNQRIQKGMVGGAVKG